MEIMVVMRKWRCWNSVSHQPGTITPCVISVPVLSLCLKYSVSVISLLLSSYSLMVVLAISAEHVVKWKRDVSASWWSMMGAVVTEVLDL